MNPRVRLGEKEILELLKDFECYRVLKGPLGAAIDLGFIPLSEEPIEIILEEIEGGMFEPIIRITDHGRTLSSLMGLGFHFDHPRVKGYFKEILEFYNLKQSDLEIYRDTSRNHFEEALRDYVAGALSIHALYVMHTFKPYELEVPKELKIAYVQWYEKRTPVRRRYEIKMNERVRGKILEHRVDFGLARNGNFPFGAKVVKPHAISIHGFHSFAVDFDGRKMGIVVRDGRSSRAMQELEALIESQQELDVRIAEWLGPDSREALWKSLDEAVKPLLAV